MRPLLLFAVLGTVVATSSVASASSRQVPMKRTPPPPPERVMTHSYFNLRQFEVGGLIAFAHDGDSHSGVLAWAPTYALDPRWSLRGVLGGSLLKSGPDSNFFALDVEVLGSYLANAWLLLEGGAGVQNWFTNGGVFAVMSAGGSFYSKDKFFEIMDRAYVRYSRVFVTDNGTNNIQIGVGISF
jgi:hypothetical protein